MSASTAKSKAILAGMQSSDWKKFMKSYTDALADYNADVADLDAKSKSEANWMSGIGKLVFVAATIALDAVIPGTGSMLRTAGIAAGAGAASMAGRALTDLWHGSVIEGPEQAAEDLRGQGYDVYDPVFNTTRAYELEKGIDTKQEAKVSAYDAYESDMWGGQWLETFSNMGTYMALGASTKFASGYQGGGTFISTPEPPIGVGDADSILRT